MLPWSGPGASGWSAWPRPRPPLDPPGNAEIPPGKNPGIDLASTAGPGAKNSRGSLPARGFHPEFLRDLPGSGCSAPGSGIWDHPRPSGARLPRAIPAGRAAHPEGEAAEFPRGKRRSWHNSWQHSWQNSRLEQQGRDGSGSSGVKNPWIRTRAAGRDNSLFPV